MKKSDNKNQKQEKTAVKPATATEETASAVAPVETSATVKLNPAERARQRAEISRKVVLNKGVRQSPD
jgi:hypothetical protein